LADNLEDGFYRGGGDDSVAEVEDVAGAVGGGGEDFRYAVVEDLLGSEEGDGIEVTLDGDRVVKLAPGEVEWGTPVEAENVAAGLAHDGKQRRGFDAEVDDRDAESLDIADEPGGGGERVVAVVGDGERADPGVEDLDDVGAGFDLLSGVVGEDGDELVHQDGPGVEVAVHHPSAAGGAKWAATFSMARET
jgi:hypothetical protein